MFCVQRSLARPDICVGRVDEARALGNLPYEVQEEEDDDTNVGGKEIGKLFRAPMFLSKDLEAVENDDPR